MAKKSKSIIQEDMSVCFICGMSSDWMEEHHIFKGNGIRPMSTKYNCTIKVNHYLHNEKSYGGIHHNPELDEALKKHAQQILEDNGMTREEFTLEFGMNYLADGENGYCDDFMQFLPIIVQQRIRAEKECA